MRSGSQGNRPRTKALLLAAGVGSRMRPLTDSVPKCLIPIAGRPLLGYWFEALERAGVQDVLLNTHHLAEQVREHLNDVNRRGPLRVVEAYEPRLLGSAGTVHANRDWLVDADQCLIVYADNLSSVSLSAFLAFHASHPDPFSMMLFHALEPHRCGIAELDGDGRIVSFVEKPREPKSDLANGGLYVVSSDAYREIADMNAFDFGFDVLPRFMGRMRGWVPDCYHRDIGTLESLQAAEKEAPAVFDGIGAGEKT
jgi:NDP-sugar pyrophosphorylase family protein